MIEGVWLSRRVGAVCWVETMTRDVAAAETSYGKVFGWSAVTEAIEDDRAYTTFFLDGEMAAGMLAIPDDLDAAIPSHWGVYFTVGDCAEAVERALALGGTVVRPPEKLDVGHFAVLADPSGAVFQIMDFTT